jgi:hypothetical protein
MYPGNVSPEHPERYAQWGDLFVYGDPELIRKLRDAWSNGWRSEGQPFLPGS